ncbi:MAG: hypothetical protein ISR65_09125 [Bacteriovoracaceae bacterium]|nr:hypothetical protein [Bacteriovoracaceae bacterium]
MLNLRTLKKTFFISAIVTCLMLLNVGILANETYECTKSGDMAMPGPFIDMFVDEVQVAGEELLDAYEDSNVADEIQWYFYDEEGFPAFDGFYPYHSFAIFDTSIWVGEKFSIPFAEYDYVQRGMNLFASYHAVAKDTFAKLSAARTNGDLQAENEMMKKLETLYGVELFSPLGAPVDQKLAIDGRYLIYSTKKEDVAEVKRLIFCKVDVNYQNELGESALAEANKLQNEELINILKDAGALND